MTRKAKPQLLQYSAVSLGRYQTQSACLESLYQDQEGTAVALPGWQHPQNHTIAP